MGQEGPRLRARLGLADATALGLGAIVGAGVFVALGQAAQAAASALPLAILLAAAVATCNGLSSAELGVAYPRAGGAYEFGYRLLWPVVGFGAGWLFLLAAIAASATYTLAFASYLQPLLPGVPLRALGVGLAVLALAANAAGVQLSRRLNSLLVIVKVGALVVFLAAGLTAFDPARLGSPTAVAWAGLLQAAALLFFAFTGYARPVTIVEEIRDPARNLPLAVIIALAASTALYLAVGIVGLGLVGAQGLATSPAPLATALSPTGLGWAQVLVSVGALVAAASVLLTEIWGLSRLSFAMARRGDLPRFLSRVSADGVPRQAVLSLGAIIVILTATVDLGAALAASSLSLLVYYAIMNWAALRLGPRQRLYPPAVSAIGLAASIALAFSLPWQSLVTVAAVLAAGLAYFAWRHRRGR